MGLYMYDEIAASKMGDSGCDQKFWLVTGHKECSLSKSRKCWVVTIMCVFHRTAGYEVIIKKIKVDIHLVVVYTYLWFCIMIVNNDIKLFSFINTL
jgi:hypothetical protein